jgi:hypothetical protein
LFFLFFVGFFFFFFFGARMQRLPSEIIEHIVYYLDVSEHAVLRSTSTLLKQFCDEERYWQCLLGESGIHGVPNALALKTYASSGSLE